MTTERPNWINEDGTIDEAAVRAAFAAAEIEGRAIKAKHEAEHAAQHGRTELRYGRVEARRGFKGSFVCLDCYYGSIRIR